MNNKNTRSDMRRYFSGVAAFSFIFTALLSVSAFGMNDALRIKIQRGSYSDETVIRFLDGATSDFDGSYDAWKFFSSNAAVPNLFTKISTGDALAINTVPSFTASVTMDLYLKIGTAATYTISAEELGAFSSGVKVIMKDLSTNLLYDLRTTATYTVSLPVIAQTAAARFQVFFSYPATTQISNATCSNCMDGAVSVVKAGESNWQYQVKNSIGNTVASGTAAGATQNISGLSSGSYTVSIAGQFSYTENRGFAVNVNPVTLGASFLEFTATPLEQEVSLRWTTGTENNTDYFTLEHSQNGIDFEGIEKVDAAGNSPVVITYTASDRSPYQNNSYYRVKLTDLNGDIIYSKIATVTMKIAPFLSVFPVPASETLNLKIEGSENSEMTLIVRDLVGGEIMNTKVTQAVGQEFIAIPVQGIFLPGVYMITVTGGGNMFEQKIIIN